MSRRLQIIANPLGYAKPLDVPFVFSSNGDGFLFHDKTLKPGDIEKEIPLDAFPSPEELWQKYKAYKGISDDLDPIVAQDCFSDGTTRFREDECRPRIVHSARDLSILRKCTLRLLRKDKATKLGLRRRRLHAERDEGCRESLIHQGFKNNGGNLSL